MSKVIIQIALKPAGYNQLIRWTPWQYAKHKAKARKLILDVIWEWEEIPRYDKADVTVTIYNKRKFDDDNLHICIKPVMDVLVEFGFFPDDNPDVVKPVVLQEKGDPGFKVVINQNQ